MPPFNNQNSTGDNFDTLTKSQVPVSYPRRSRRLRKSWMRCATLAAQTFLHLRYGLHLKVSVLRPKHPPRLAAEERSYQEASKSTVDFAFIQTFGTAGRMLWAKCYLPYVALNFVAIPAAFLFMSRDAAWNPSTTKHHGCSAPAWIASSTATRG